MGIEDLLDSIANVAASVTRPVLSSVADALSSLPSGASDASKLATAELAPHPTSRDALHQLMQLWTHSHPAISQESMALMIRTAAAVSDAQDSRHSLELVWTGPSHPSVSFRRTDQALYEIIGGARESMLIATYAAYNTPDLDRALLNAVARGLSISMIVESSEISQGKMKFGAFEGLPEPLLEKLLVYVWPLNMRERDASGNYGSLHVKCAVADDSVALVSSANLTGYAFTLNMELGILIRGGEVPRQIAHHLRYLIEVGTLALCSA